MEDFKDAIAARLLEKRVIELRGEIENETAERICAAIIYLNEMNRDLPITLYIDSPGGYIRPALDIYIVVKKSQAPVTGIVIRRASSMAAIVLQACRTRKIYLHADIKLHHVTQAFSLDELEDPKIRFRASRDSIKNQEFIIRELSARIGKSIKQVKRLLGRGRDGREFDASAAKQAGLVDEVIE